MLDLPPWVPPSSALVQQDGVWRAIQHSEISYPASGNQDYLQIEDQSYWFAHRVECLRAAMALLPPPAGVFLDIGGGNGHVAAALQRGGHDVALIEPGEGALNARQRGIRKVIQATLDDAALHTESFAATGAFDVVEHIDDHVAFLKSVHRLLRPQGRFYGTVPACPELWSGEDDSAGHFRRYRSDTLRSALEQAGFEVEYVSPFFSWLVLPLALLRTLPYRMPGGRDRSSRRTIRSDHTIPVGLSALIRSIHEWEIRRLQARKPIPFGTSLLWVARRSDDCRGPCAQPAL